MSNPTDRQTFTDALDEFGSLLADDQRYDVIHEGRSIQAKRDNVLALYDAKQAECDRLREKLAQIVEDVDAVDGGIDLYLFYERMQANAVDARALLAPERSAEK